jgi:AcrR family transcriptional regulator
MLEHETNSHSETQRRIIEASGEIFADSGYRHTTIRAICDRAGVNVAAVNYHFGGKQNLYLAVLKHWRTKAFEENPLDLTLYAGRPPEERLRAFVATLLARVLNKDEGSLFPRLMAQEFIQPTSALDVIIEETIRPAFNFLSETVGQLLGDSSSGDNVRFCCMSVVGQIFYFYMARPVVRKLFNQEGFDEKATGPVADHITRFSLYAINRMAAKCEGEKEC